MIYIIKKEDNLIALILGILNILVGLFTLYSMEYAFKPLSLFPIFMGILLITLYVLIKLDRLDLMLEVLGLMLCIVGLIPVVVLGLMAIHFSNVIVTLGGLICYIGNKRRHKK